MERAGALNFKSSGMFEGQVHRNKRTHGFIHVTISGRTPSFNMKAVHEAPGKNFCLSLRRGPSEDVCRY